MNRTVVLRRIQKNIGRLSAPDPPKYKCIPLYQKLSPSIITLHEVMRLLRTVIFPGFSGMGQEVQLGSIQYYTGVYSGKVYDLLQEQIYNGLYFGVECCCDSKDRASEISIAFANRTPHIKYLLPTDVRAISDGDPVVKSMNEIISCYPAVYAFLHQRVAHELFELSVPVLPCTITEVAHLQTGTDIHPGTRIGEHFSIDYGTGIVVERIAIIGSHIRLYQGVTSGAKSFTLNEEGLPINLPRYPIIKDYVTIYSDISILGRITIDRGPIIRSNIWLIHNVPPNSKISQSRIREEFTEV